MYIIFNKIINDIIKNEISNLICKRSSIQICYKAIKSRENCLVLLKSTLVSNYFDIKNKGKYLILYKELLEKCYEILSHLRILNINVVESIFKWREGIFKDFQLSDSKLIQIPFIYEKQNYLLKVK